MLKNGADEIVYPERQLATWTAIRYSADHIFDYIELDDEHAIYEVQVPEDWVGKTVGELDVRKKYSLNIMALKEDGILNLAITPETGITANQTMLVLGTIKQVQKVFHI